MPNEITIVFHADGFVTPAAEVEAELLSTTDTKDN